MAKMRLRKLTVLICTFGVLSVVANGPESFAQGNDAQLYSFVQHRLQVAESGGRICSVAQVDLSGEKTNTVLASIDWSGRAFCNDVWLLRTIPADDQHFEAWNVDNVGKLIVSLGAPEEKQLAIPRSWSAYNGAQCVATWTAIYRERDGKVEDESPNYTAFYQNRLRTLLDRLDHGEADMACTQMEADKIKRFLGLASNAGFDLAQRWIQSSDSLLRTKAVSVLGDIGDEPSRQVLRRIAAGDSPEAVLAKHFLEPNPAK